MIPSCCCLVICYIGGDIMDFESFSIFSGILPFLIGLTATIFLLSACAVCLSLAIHAIVCIFRDF